MFGGEIFQKPSFGTRCINLTQFFFKLHNYKFGKVKKIAMSCGSLKPPTMANRVKPNGNVARFSPIELYLAKRLNRYEGARI